jgi:hypothetical protein
MRAVWAITRASFAITDGVGLAFAAERARHGVDHSARHVDHGFVGGQQNRDQHCGDRAGQINCPLHLFGALPGALDHRFDRTLFVGEFLRPHHFAGLIDRAGVMAQLADIDSDPHRHRRSPVFAGQPVDSSADLSLNSDDSHQLSISGQSVQHGGAASLRKPHLRQQDHSYTPPPWASEAPTPDVHDLRDKN